MNTRALSLALLGLGLFGLTACNYDFPLTEKPTAKIDPRLIGDWVAYDEDEQDVEPLSIRRLDEYTYVVATDGDIYLVTHSTLDDLPLLSVQDLQPGKVHGKYAYYDWKLSDDGARLTVRIVRTKVVPEDTPDAATARRLILDHRADPEIFAEPTVFTPKRH